MIRPPERTTRRNSRRAVSVSTMWWSTSPLAYYDERIEHLAVQGPRVPRLRSVACVGPVTAAAFLAVVAISEGGTGIAWRL